MADPKFTPPVSGSFLEKLRMNNLFPVGGGPQTYGMPDLDRYSHYEEPQYRETSRIPKIGNQIASPNFQPLKRPEADIFVKSKPGVDEFGRSVQFKETRPTPLQREELDLKHRSIELDAMLAAQKLGTQSRAQDIQQQRANVYEFKAKNPNLKIVIPKGGNIQAIDPISGQVVQDLGPSGTMSEEEKQQLVGDQRLDQISKQGENQSNLQQMRGNQAIEQIGTRIAGQKEIQSMKPATSMSPSQIANQQVNVANELRNTRPDLAQFISIDANGQVMITPPSEPGMFGGGGPTPEQFNEMKTKIYGGDINLPQTVKPTTPTAKPTAADLIRKYSQ